jgi:hypothetical protein
MVSVDGGYLTILPGMLAMGLGMGLAMTPSTEAITGSLPRSRQGVASALNDVTRELGSALGVALLGAVLTAGYQSSMDSRLDDGAIPAATADVARQGVANALAVADRAGAQGPDLSRDARLAFVEGWQGAMWAGLAAVVVLFAYVVLRGPVSSRRPAVPRA